MKTTDRGLTGALIACLILLTVNGFAQQPNLHPIGQHLYFANPNAPRPHVAHHQRDGRAARTCDTIFLDYNTYNEVWANEQTFNFTGSWNSSAPSVLAQEIAPFVDSAHQYDYTYVQVVFDSLVQSDVSSASILPYIPLSVSTISLDSLGILIGVSGDTTLNGRMLHDSLVFEIYSTDGAHNISPTPVKTVTFAGRSQLSPFLTGPQYLGYVQIGIGQTFQEGQGFAIKMIYLAHDTSSHLLLSYTYADSCGTIDYQGQNFTSPAYPSPFVGNASWGAVTLTGSTPSVEVENSTYQYSISGIPTNCSYVYNQNWELLPIIGVCTRYSAIIQATPANACAGQEIVLSAYTYGTNVEQDLIDYTWSVSSGTLTSNIGGQTSVIAANDYPITVTVTADDGDSVTTTTYVIPGCNGQSQGLSVNLGGNQQICHGSQITLNANVNGGIAPYTYAWSGTGDALSCQTCAHPQITFTQNSTYRVTVTDAQHITASAIVNYTVASGSQLPIISASSTAISCQNLTDTTVLHIANAVAPISVAWGDGNGTNGGTTQTHNYTAPGVYVISVFDSAHCGASVFDTVLNSGIAINVVQTAEPNCPNSNGGSIKVNATGGTAPYHYAWSNGFSGDSVVNVIPGGYRVSVTDATNCSAMLAHYLAPANDVGYYVYLTSVNANCGNAGSVTATVYNGTAPYNYLWSDGTTGASVGGLVSNTYSVTVSDNAGCTTTGHANIVAHCVHHITGTIYNDANNNCVLDNGEARLNDVYVEASGPGGYYYSYVYNNGDYDIEVDQSGTYTINAYYYWYSCGNISVCGAANNTITLVGANDSSNYNIGFHASGGYNLGIYPSWSAANPGFTKEYRLYAQNYSATPFTGIATVTLGYDTNLVYLSSNGNGGVNDPYNHTVKWQVSAATLNNNYAYLAADFHVPVTLNINQQLYTSMRIDPTAGDCDSSDNYFGFSEVVTGSFDPNEKSVVPAEHIVETDSVLIYTIHYQNTGNDSTHFIIVRDTLSPNLDPATVRNVAYSHKYSDFEVSGHGVLTWTFNPLRLVDSITDPVNSKGFLSFSVKKKKDLPIGTSITNTASIYFDYNTPVQTNTVVDTVSSPVYVFDVKGNDAISVRAFPNPFTNVTHIVVNGLESKFDFELYDVTGKLQQRISPIGNNQFELQRGNLPQGVYLYRISAGGRQVAYGKLVVQ